MRSLVGAMAQQAERAGYHSDWRPFVAKAFHRSIDGRPVWPFERCERKWDGSGYDPDWLYRKL